MPGHLRIGTRGSQLALFQAATVADLLRDTADCEIVVIKTSGDHLAEAPLSQIGGKRLFVKEIEDALLEGRIDLAVHSAKDMPAVQPDGLIVGAVLAREDARDAVVLPAGRLKAASTTDAEGLSIDELQQVLGDAPRIGTSSIRRTAQLRALFRGATFAPIRGNLDTRLRKLDDGGYDAIVLAAAGLRRLGQEARISAYLPAAACVPAPGQGIIAIEIRNGDPRAREVVARIDEPVASMALIAEREVVTRLGGGCQMPIGAHAAISSGALSLAAVVVSMDGARSATAEVHGAAADARRLGTEAADLLLKRGAREILADVARAHATVEGLQP